jgi:hypothetical protein
MMQLERNQTTAISLFERLRENQRLTWGHTAH